MIAQKKDCFGILERVFPLGNEGLREIVPTCFECHEKKRVPPDCPENGRRFQTTRRGPFPATGWGDDREIAEMVGKKRAEQAQQD